MHVATKAKAMAATCNAGSRTVGNCEQVLKRYFRLIVTLSSLALWHLGREYDFLDLVSSLNQKGNVIGAIEIFELVF